MRCTGGELTMVGLAIALMVAACDRSPAPPPQLTQPPQADPATQPAETPRPTTQELLSGPYKTIPLPAMPLSVRAPQSWKIDIAGPIMFLLGPTPHSQATIQLAQHDTMGPEQIDMLIERGKREQQEQPDAVKRIELRDVGKMKVLERVQISRPIVTPKLDASGNAIFDEKGAAETITTTPVRWTLTVFVPYQQAFSRYELNFIDLTTDQYAVDKEFLEKVVNSLAYEPQAGQ